jgi:hypothetical protein
MAIQIWPPLFLVMAQKFRWCHKFPLPPRAYSVLQEPPERAGMPPPRGPSGDPPKASSADWRPTASKNEASSSDIHGER